MTSKRVLFIGAVLAVVVIAGLCRATPAIAQTLSGDASFETLSNRYLLVSLGKSGNVDTDFEIPGRWAVVTTEGDPEVTGDNNQELVFLGAAAPCGLFGYFKIRIADTNYLVGDTTTGGWAKAPTAYAAPPPGLGLGRTGGYIDAEWTVSGGSSQTTGSLASVKIRMSIVRDQGRFEFTLTNLAATTQKIGFAMTGDSAVGPLDQNGYAYLPGVGYWRQAASVPKCMGSLLIGSKVPEMFEIMDSVDSPTVVARNTLKLQDCTAPDCAAIGEYSDLAPVSMWPPTQYKPDPMSALADVTWSLCWNPAAMGRNGTRKIVTYYGVGAASTSWTYRVGRRMESDSVALAVQGPRALKYDSTTIDHVDHNDMTPFPATISAYVYNLATDPGPYTLDDVTVSLYLPLGLQLSTDTAQTAQQSVGRVAVNSESQSVTWAVVPTGEYSGELEYFVTARDVSGWQQIVSRKITVPATKKSVFRSGYQLMSVPFTFNNMSVEHALGLSAGSFGARYYDPVANKYLPLTQLQPGQSFWMYISSVKRGTVLPFEVAADGAIVGEDSGKQLREQYVVLKRGWNLVSNPFVYPMYWGQVLVANTSDPVISTVSLDQAVTNGWLSKTLFSWIPESGTYDHFSDTSRLLLPWRGYWVYARSAVTLVLRPPVPPASDVTTEPGG
jgi:hypothetical protein